MAAKIKTQKLNCRIAVKNITEVAMDYANSSSAAGIAKNSQAYNQMFPTLSTPCTQKSLDSQIYKDAKSTSNNNSSYTLNINRAINTISNNINQGIVANEEKTLVDKLATRNLLFFQDSDTIEYLDKVFPIIDDSMRKIGITGSRYSITFGGGILREYILRDYKYGKFRRLGYKGIKDISAHKDLFTFYKGRPIYAFPGILKDSSGSFKDGGIFCSAEYIKINFWIPAQFVVNPETTEQKLYAKLYDAKGFVADLDIPHILYPVHWEEFHEFVSFKSSVDALSQILN